jgi:hypothetical protein
MLLGNEELEMTNDERMLLLQTARAVSEILDANAGKMKTPTSDNLSHDIKSLIERVRPKVAA